MGDVLDTRPRRQRRADGRSRFRRGGLAGSAGPGRTRRLALAIGAIGAAVITTGAVAAALLVDDGDGAAGTPGAPTARLTYEQLAGRPSRGNLAQDSAFLSALDQAWSDDETNQVLNVIGQDSEVLTPPHVVWAGSSPTGPAAMIVAKVRLEGAWNGYANPPDGEAWVAGFVGEDELTPGGIAVKDADIVTDIESSSWFVEANGSPKTIAVVDTGGRYVWNTGFASNPDSGSFPGREPLGSVGTDDFPVSFVDGVAFITVPAETDPDEIQVLRDGDMVLGGSDEPIGEGNESKSWVDKAEGPARIVGLGKTDTAAAAKSAANLRSKLLSTLPAGLTPAEPVWLAAGKLPDGTVAVVYLDAFGRTPTHVFLALITPDGGDIQHVGRAGARRGPVFANLVDGTGRIVVQFGARLRYETAEGGVSPAAKHAVFVPGGASSITIEGPGGGSYPAQ